MTSCLRVRTLIFSSLNIVLVNHELNQAQLPLLNLTKGAKSFFFYLLIVLSFLRLTPQQIYRQSIIVLFGFFYYLWHACIRLWSYIYYKLHPAMLTLTLPSPSAGVSGSLDSYCSLKPLCSGMGEVVPARTSPTLLPPAPRTVLSLSCFKVSQCINCRDWHCKS